MKRPTLAQVLVPLGALLCLLPWVTGGMALVAGAAIALSLGNPFAARTRKLAQYLLQISVVGLGFGMDLRVVARAGMHGIGFTFLSIVCCLALGTLLAKLFQVAGRTGLLISVGTAICGGSAIAAVAPVLRAEEDEIAVSLATVFLLNAVALLIFPRIGHAVDLSQPQFGMWAALAIHDTSSVVGAGKAYGPQALDIATTVKLARALWIVPLTLLVGAWVSRQARSENNPQPSGAPQAPRARPKPPWFIAGFVAAAAIVTFIPALQPAGRGIRSVAQQLLVMTLFLIGTGLSRKALKTVGTRPLAQALILWMVVATVSLSIIKLA